MVAIDELLSVWEERQEQGAPISPEELCRQCPEMLEEVRWHIRALQAVDSLFGATPNDQAPSTVKPEPAPDPIRSGPVRVTSEYKIERLHASGGLGHVFLATDPVLNRKVAIKFPKWNRLTREQRARFEREARVTGRLDHPGIVPVHAIKQDEPNRPCYVMRFVEGQTLQERVEELYRGQSDKASESVYGTLEFRQLLQRFVSLCNTVGYAHDQGVIHRDIKPGNVILGPFEETLLLDWGLAKVQGEVEPERAPDAAGREPLLSGVTRTGEVLGTPAYASPEQLLGQADRVDARSDVFSLGATLYFILTGRLPLKAEDMSGHLARLGQTSTSLLNPGAPVPRPLAAICRKATCVTSDLRFPSSLALATEIQRYLAGEPVDCLRDSWPVRVQRWLRKHPRTAVGSAVAFGLLTMFAILASTWMASFNRRLGNANDDLLKSNSKLEEANVLAEAARLRAENNFETARSAVNEFLVKVTEHPRLNQNDFTDLQTELLASARPFYEALLAQQPGDAEVEFARADAHHRLAQIDRECGNNAAAQEGYLAAMQVFGQLPQQSRETDEVRVAEANCRENYGLLLRQTGDSAGAHEQYLASLAAIEPVLAENPGNPVILNMVAGTRVNISHVLDDLGRQEEAAEEVTRAIEIQQPLVDQGNSDVTLREFLSTAYRTRAILHIEAARYDMAEQDLPRAIALAEGLLSEAPDDARWQNIVASLYQNRGVLKRGMGELDAACEELRKSADVSKALAARFPSQYGYQESVANCLNTLATTCIESGRLAEGLETYAAALDIWRGLVNRHPDQPDLRAGLATTLSNFAAELDAPNERARAADCLREAIAIREQLCRENPVNPTLRILLAGAVMNYGTHLQIREPASALEWYDRALIDLQSVLDQHSDSVLAKQFMQNALLGRAKALRDLARFAEAVDYFRRAADHSDAPLRQNIEHDATHCEAMVENGPRMEAILAGTQEPKNSVEHGDLAAHCYQRRMYLRSAQVFQEVFAIDPVWPGRAWYLAARVAAMAAAHEGVDTETLTESESAQWREQCRKWLEQAMEELAEEGEEMKTAQREWLDDNELASVRDSGALQAMPTSERALWEAFWKNVRDQAESN